VLRERIAAPLGFPDELFFGMPEDKRGSLATLVDAPSEVDWSTHAADGEFADVPRRADVVVP
jgi:hypothetical protein